MSSCSPKNLIIGTLAFTLGITVSATSLPAQSGRESKFFCREQGRLLGDDEFLEIAFGYEASKDDFPEQLRSLGISGIRELDPGCCVVLREDNPFLENRSRIERWLFDPWVLVLIDWDLKNSHVPPRDANYGMTICGEIVDPGSPRWSLGDGG